MAVVAYIVCGILAGTLGGYLGLGGGIVIVPFLTLVMGLGMRAAVPVSMAAIVINSLASSSEYMKKGMVDLELVVTLTLSMVIGMVIGSSLLSIVSPAYLKLLLAIVLIYAAYSFLKGPSTSSPETNHRSAARLFWCSVLALAGGVIASMVGVGGGVIVIPLMYLVLGVPLGTARGTSSFVVGVAGAASLAVYFLSGIVNLSVLPPVVLGAIVGGKLGGKLGTMAKPLAVKIVFVIVILYVAGRLAWGAMGELR
ncbi:MAG: sulfite exporter TauE/SafE family protein [Candidatus Zixiibacteriota bacterium]